MEASNDQAPTQEAVPTSSLTAPVPVPTQNWLKKVCFWVENMPVAERHESTIDQLPTTSPPQGSTTPQDWFPELLPLQPATRFPEVLATGDVLARSMHEGWRV